MSAYFMFSNGMLALNAIVMAMLLSACSQPVSLPSTPPKPVKVEVVGETASNQINSFVGTVRARQRTDLSFESSGRVTAILVDIGDHVRAGQVLATLDDAPARWQLKKAQADRDTAAAILAERRTQLHQQESLVRDGVVSPAALPLVQAACQQAASQLNAADTAVASARRNLSLTRITAPFEGEIVARPIQPFTEVAPAQPILLLESGSGLDVVVMLPEAVATTLKPGTPAYAISDNRKIPMALEHLSGRSDNGSLVQAIFRVQQTIASVRSGSVVAVELSTGKSRVVSLPATAVMPDTKAGQGSVFVINSKGTLQRRLIQTDGELLPAGRIAITGGLNHGEKVVVAGTSFLKEGQAVAVHQSQTVFQESNS